MKPNWLCADGPESDIVLSTRVRLARNLEDYPFPCLGMAGSLGDVVALAGARCRQCGDLTYQDVYRVHPLELQLFMEQHLVSPAFTASNLPRGLALSPDAKLSVMINEEDHLRLQSLVSGLQFEPAFEAVCNLEAQLGEGLRYAFDDQFGYLTACPSNLGTGLRASAMLHLPALAWMEALESIVHQVGQLGLTVRGVYGEGSRAAGHLIQVSNQVTLGPTEDEMLSKIKTVCEQLLRYERSARQQLLAEQRLALEDRVWRAYSILANARLLESAEAMEHLSLLRLGVDLQLVPAVPLAHLNGLLVRMRPANLQIEAGRELSATDRDALRATIMREALSKA